MEEIWKIMKEHKNYEVSNCGKVKNKKTGRILKTTKNNKGYERFIVYINKKPSIFYMHRVVANNFIDNPNNYEQINHKNEDKLDNRVENLEWCNNKYNANYGTRNKRIIEKKRHTFKTIIQKDKNDNIVKIWKDICEIQEQTNYDKHNIYKSCEKKYKYAYGYKWEYATL